MNIIPRRWRKEEPDTPPPGVFTASYNPPHLANPAAIPISDWGKAQLTAYYRQNVIAAKFVDMLVDDMLIKWRHFLDDDQAMSDAEVQHFVQRKLARAMKGARLYGGAVLAIITAEAPLHTPLEPDRIKPGDLLHLLYSDRYNIELRNVITDITDPLYGTPSIYRLRLNAFDKSKTLDVHSSRILRFDGLPPTDGPATWGDSVLTASKVIIDQDTELAKAAAYLVDRASLDVLKVEGFQEMLSLEAQANADKMSLKDLAEAVNSQKSTYRTIFMGGQDAFERHTYSFAGIGDLFDRYARRLAAASGIPQTRFWGASPVGLNATGDSDAANYAIQVAAWQEYYLAQIILPLDQVLAKSVGLAEPPEYEWVPLLDMSETDRAIVTKTKMETIVAGVNGGIIDEVEARQALIADDMFADIDPEAVPEVEEPDPMMMQPPTASRPPQRSG